MVVRGAVRLRAGPCRVMVRVGRLIVAIAIVAGLAVPAIAQAALYPINDDFVRQRAIAENKRP